MHQSNILLFPLVILSLALSPKTRGRLARPLTVFSVVFCVVALLPYPIAGWHLAGTRTVRDLYRWLTGTHRWGGWGVWRVEIIPATAVGLIRSFTGSHYLLGFGRLASYARRLFPIASLEDEIAVAQGVPGWLRLPLLVVQSGVIVFALRTCFRTLAGLKRVLSRYALFGFMLLGWIVLFGVFFAWWAPERVEFWIAWFVPVLTVAALASGQRVPGKSRQTWQVTGFLAGLFFINFFGSIYPQSGPVTELDTSFAVAIDPVVAKGDIVVSDCSFAGRASRFVQSFERVNLLDPGIEGLSLAGPATLYRRKTPRKPEIVVSASDSLLISELRAHALSRLDSLMAVAEAEHRAVYIVVSPLSADPRRAFIYSRLVDSIRENYDISESVPVRSTIDLRRVLR